MENIVLTRGASITACLRRQKSVHLSKRVNIGLNRSSLPQLGRRGQNLVLREARVGEAVQEKTDSGNGNGAVYSNGAVNGVVRSNGYGNGAAYLAQPNSIASNGNGAYSSNGNGAAPANGYSNGASKNGKAVASVVETLQLEKVEVNGDVLDACEAGQLEACAIDRIAEREAQKAAEPAAVAAAPQTPYKSPGGRWSQFKSYSVWQRSFDIWRFAFVFLFKWLGMKRKSSYGKQGMTPEAVSQRKTDLAIWLREGLVKLGPTFIKIGQQFSTRVDVLSPEFVRELEKLQDNVPSFDSDAAIDIVERGLKGKIGDIFEEFDREPIAAASLGQVHLAKLNGKTIVVKVQRPGLKDLFDIDLKNVRVLAQWLQRLDPKSDGAARDWVAIYDECSRILYQEIDYALEGANADRFRKMFAASDWIKVPEVYWQYTTSEVLTMEYAPGVKINRIAEIDKMGVDRKRLARLAVESYLQQLLVHGFFHADPHPGNIAVDAEGSGRLIYYDFGMMGTIPSDVRSGLLELFYGVYQKDTEQCIDALITMGVLVPGGDRVAIKRTAEFFLGNLSDRLKAQKEEAKNNPEYGSTFKTAATKEEKAAKRKQILATIGEDLLLASADKPFRFPATFTFVVRSFTVLDGIGKGLDPRFDISEIAAPYARNLLLEAQPQFAKLQADLGKRLALQNRAVVNLFKGPNMIEDVARTISQLERGDLKLRVRALEAERALNRVQAMQKVTTTAVAASALVNVGTVLSVSACNAAASASFLGASVLGVILIINWLKVRGLEKKEAQLLGT